MKLPKSFKVAGNTITVNIVDELASQNYGEFDDINNTITIATSINGIKLTDNQIRSTFYHELIHAFQFYYKSKTKESEAQVFSNFICEYLDTREEDNN